MLFCDDEYRRRLLSDLKVPWADYWEALLSLSKTAVDHDGWDLAGFFFLVEARGEYVLGPHWIADSFGKAPFIRRNSEHPSWLPLKGRDQVSPQGWIREPADADGTLWEWAMALDEKLLFYGIAGDLAILGSETSCWRRLEKLIGHPRPDLSPE